jgi:hypothetical protein
MPQEKWNVIRRAAGLCRARPPCAEGTKELRSACRLWSFGQGRFRQQAVAFKSGARFRLAAVNQRAIAVC